MEDVQYPIFVALEGPALAWDEDYINLMHLID